MTADVYDLVPGRLTLSADWPDPEPFPVAHLPVAEPSTDLELDPQAPLPDTEAVADLVAAFAADPAVGPHPAVLVTDALTGQKLAGMNEAEPMVPASTTKLLTAVAALEAAGAGYEFTTTVLAGASGDEEAITLLAGGDLTLAAGEGDPSAVIGRAGIHDLAEQVATSLAAAGRESISQLVVDESLWHGPRIAPRWTDQDLAEGWTIPLAPIAVDLGRIEGQLARTDDPAGDAGRALARALADRGVALEGEVVLGEAPAGAGELGQVRSAPLAELAEYMLVHSDNVLAEALGRLVAVETGHPASFEGVEAAITDQLTRLGIATDGLVLADASGLSSVNQISAQMLVEVLAQLLSGEHPQLLATVRGLPVAGLEGTLRTRMRETAAAGTISAKTGSLRATATIAGQVHTASGRVLLVAIMTHDWDSSLAGARMGIDRLLVGLAECGCPAAEP